MKNAKNQEQNLDQKVKKKIISSSPTNEPVHTATVKTTTVPVQML